jgi:hypothetical protein
LSLGGREHDAYRFSGGVDATVPCVFLRDTPVAFVSEHRFRDEPSEVNP